MNRATPATGWVRNPDGTLGWTWNPITGCLNHDNGLCKGGGFPCYAYKLANTRLKQRCLENKNTAPLMPNILLPNLGFVEMNPFYPRFWEDRLEQVDWLDRKPKGIFVCDMGDLFGVGIPEDWTNRVLDHITQCKQHRFYLLTKQPQNLIKFSPFPENCWVGVTVTLAEDEYGHDCGIGRFASLSCLKGVNAKVKYLSFEPLLGRLCIGFTQSWWADTFKDSGINWLIIGACTGTEKEMTSLARNNSSFLTEMPYGTKWTAQPNPEWVQEIVEAADKAGVRVFLKDNLKPLLEQDSYYKFFKGYDIDSHELRQELPV